MAISNLAPKENQIEPKDPKGWLKVLADNGLLRWDYGHENIGLLLVPLLEVTGWQGDVMSLCDALPATTNKVSVNDITGIMSALGYRITSIPAETSKLKPEDLPALFIPEKPDGWCAGIVLQEINTYGTVWHDGREKHRDELPDCSGRLYRFERIQDDTDVDDATPVQRTSWLRGMSDRFSPLFWHAMALSLIMHFFTLAMPLFSMVVYDRVVTAKAPETLPLLAIGVIGALLVEKAIRWVRIRLSSWMGARSGMMVTAAMFERLLFLPASVIEQAPVSAQLARVRAFEAVRDFITGPMFLTVLELPFLLVLVFVISILAGPVAWVPVSVAAAYGLLLFCLHPSWKRVGREAAHTAAQKQQLLMEITANLKPIFAAGLSPRMVQRYRTVSWQASRAQSKFNFIASTAQYIGALLTVLAGIATIAWSLERIWAGQMSGGAMVATMIITWRVLYPLQVVCAILPNLEQVRGSAKQVSHLMSLPPEAHAARHALAERQLKGHISFQNVGLRYSRKSDPVFLGLNADIKQGQIVAIFGGNGCGKSSILRLIMGLYPTALGNIRLDDVDHRQFDPRSLRRQIAYLPQTPELLPGTIADNLRTVNPLAADYKLRQALLWADAWEQIEALPAGINTVIGEEQTQISSGFAARICLARMYLSERPIVLCDEMSAQLLNSSTGERFRRFLNDCRGNRTVIFVTHREDWLKEADQVIWMRQDGRIAVGKPNSNPKEYEQFQANLQEANNGNPNI